jgi:hypothetical protein
MCGDNNYCMNIKQHVSLSFCVVQTLFLSPALMLPKLRELTKDNRCDSSKKKKKKIIAVVQVNHL